MGVVKVWNKFHKAYIQYFSEDELDMIASLAELGFIEYEIV